MYKKLFKTSLMAAALSVIYACSPDEQVAPKIDSINKSEDVVACDMITFENATTRNASGFITNVASTGGQTIGVQGFRRTSGGPSYGTTNYANLFNTTGTNPGGSDDTDLMMAETGKVLIVNGTDNSGTPDDFANGSKLMLDFSSMGSVTLNSLTYLDNEETGTTIRLYNAANMVVNTIPVPAMGDGSVQTVNLGNTAGVVRMEVILGSGNTGSGAIDNIQFCPQVQPPCDIITFEQAVSRNASGFVTSVKSLYNANIGIQGFRRINGGSTYTTTSYANLFNTTGTNPGGSDDTDLMMAETGNVLIVNEVKNPDNASIPDDFARGSKLVVDFSSLGTVRLSSLTYLDNEEAGTKIYLYGVGGVLLNTISVPAAGDGSVQTVNLGNTAGVVRMEVVLGSGATGSGAIDNIVFCPEPPKTGCTRTQGYWKNHASDSKHYDATWAKVGESTAFFKSGATYRSILDIQPRGNAYYILAHQYVATTLNLKVASAPAAVLAAYTQATTFFNAYTPAQVAANKALETQATQLAGILDAYNNGVTGPGHCAD
ncbi:hypothetical protein AAE02nite_27850 [Adhaeribacter aerolatus]|uniref:Uncharacterized protein n=1 Tax=Adhaeribacter aerolatus TaxID=670289 RepID=A0A512AZG8_9BACT|nr:hypothetical protein [Adhaeribacter aerolatus]GEO05121.1 hypothetical protein AAE02nite_27850 [Adhaeribacter aerolatus]